MTSISNIPSYSKSTNLEFENMRWRLTLLRCFARRLVPSVALWAVLHDQWRRAELSCDTAEMAALCAGVDAALGGRCQR